MLFGGRSLRANLVLAALVVCISQAGWAQDNSSAENKDDVPGADATTADDRNDVPGADATTAASPDEMFASVIDLPFKQYVDITLLRSAYSNGDASSLIDIGLQLQEGERVLQRSHRAFEARQILDIAVRFATAQQDTGSLDRLAKAAELSGNKALVESVNVARQLASQQRAAVPPIPEASETLTLEEIAVLDSIPRQLEKARAIGSRAALLALQSRLEQSPLEQGEYRAYLEAQLVDAISETSDSEEEGDAAIKALEALSGETRGITFAPLGMSVANPRTKAVRTAYYQGAQPAYEVSSGSVTYLDLIGIKHTVPKNTIEGLRAVYGSIYVNYGTFMEIQVDAQGNALIQNGSRPFCRENRGIVEM